MLYNSILDTIGNTPLVKLQKFSANPNVQIYVKLEGQNPGGSIKDRIALQMIEKAEESGALTKDKIILEATSGNTGIGLAMIATYKGYQIKLTMSAGMSEERKKMLRAFGAELVLTDPTLGTDGAILKAQEIFKNAPEKYWMPDQYSNQNNPEAHIKHTAEEILKDLPEVEMVIATLGTSGTIMGLSQKLKKINPQIKLIAVEPYLKHKLQGLKNMEEAMRPLIYNEKLWDEKINVHDEEAHQALREFIKTEGIFAGMSSGAALCVAKEKSKNLVSGNIVVICPDRGEKYLSTELFQ